MLINCTHQLMGQMGKKYQSPWLKGKRLSSMVKTHTTTSPQYTSRLPFQGGIDVAQLHSSTNGPNGEKDQNPWVEGEGWCSLIKTHTTTFPQYTCTLPLEGVIAVAQLHSSSSRPIGEKRPKSVARGRKMG